MPNPFRKNQPVRVEIDGQTFEVRPLSAGAYAEMIRDSKEFAHKPEYLDYIFLALSVYDAEGNKVFTDAEDVYNSDVVAVNLLAEAAQQANGLGDILSKKN